MDESTGGPGAPTPVSALEVGESNVCSFCGSDLSVGCQRLDGARHQARSRGRLQHCRSNCLYVSPFDEIPMAAGLTPNRPRKALEQIKGISEQKASKLLAEGERLFAIS
jgi:hypothetical protein